MNSISGGAINTRGLNGDTGAQIVKSAEIADAVQIVHTVTAGKILYLSSRFLTHTAGATGEAKLFIRDGSDTLVAELAYLRGLVNIPIDSFGPYVMPIKIPAGYDVCVSSNAAALSAHCAITGWEEPV